MSTGLSSSSLSSNHASIPIELPSSSNEVSSNVDNKSGTASRKKSATGTKKSTASSKGNKMKFAPAMIPPTAFINGHPPGVLVPMSQMQIIQGAANAAMPFYHPMPFRLDLHGHPHLHMEIPLPAKSSGNTQSLKKPKVEQGSDTEEAQPNLPPPPPYAHPFPPFATYDGRPIMNPAQSIAANAHALLRIQRRLQSSNRTTAREGEENKNGANEEPSSGETPSTNGDSTLPSSEKRNQSVLHPPPHLHPPFGLHPFPPFPLFPMVPHPHHTGIPLPPLRPEDMAQLAPISVAQMQQIVDQHRNGKPSATASTGAKKRNPSAEAKQRRKERNKLLARRTRQRKKVENEALRDQFITLLLENEKLRHAVKEKIDPSIAYPLISKPFELPDNVKEFLKGIVNAHQKALWTEITSKQRSYCIVDPYDEGHPILHVSRGFCDLTGYSPQEAVGRNCRFLQGPKTDPVVSKLIGDHLRNKQDIVATLLNYRKNGDMFWNKLEIHHCFDEDNRVKFVIGVQTECDDNYIFTRWARRRSTDLLLQKDDDEKEEDDDEGDEDDEDDSDKNHRHDTSTVTITNDAAVPVVQQEKGSNASKKRKIATANSTGGTKKKANTKTITILNASSSGKSTESASTAATSATVLSDNSFNLTMASSSSNSTLSPKDDTDSNEFMTTSSDKSSSSSNNESTPSPKSCDNDVDDRLACSSSASS